MKREKIDSSLISEIGYLDETLEVLFANGKLYRYVGVPKYIYLAWLQSDSKGSYFTRFIKNVYPTKEVKSNAQV